MPVAAAWFLGRLFLSWFAIVAATFFLLRMMPGDPVEIFLAQVNLQAGPETVAAYRQQWGLDGPLSAQFLRWCSGFFRLDWGQSFETGQAVSEDFANRLPYSAAIGFGGLCTAVALGYALGFFAALRPGGAADLVSRGLAIAGQALPAFALGLIMLWVLGVKLRWINPFGDSALEQVILPTALVAFFSTGSFARLTCAGLGEVRQAAYFRTALAKGRSQIGALWLHGRRAGALTLIAGLAPELAWVVGGTAVAEIVFGVPGLSERVVQAVNHRDYAVLQPYIALVALWVTLILQGAGVLRRVLDPRVS